jgi:hypothetical protein
MSPKPSEGRVEGFWQVVVAPDAFADSLKSKTPVPSDASTAVSTELPAVGDLPLKNIASARVWVQVNGTKIGLLGPYSTGVLHGVQAGYYDVSMTVPNGYARTSEVRTSAQPLHAIIP